MIEQLTAEAFAAIELEWDALNPSGSLFSSHSWIRTWLEHYGRDEHVVLVHREGGILQAGTLFRVNGGTYGQFLEETPWPWIAARPEIANPYAAFLDYLRHQEHVKKVVIVHAPAKLQAGLEAMAGYTCLTSFARNSRAMDVSGSFAEYEKALKKRVRHNLHRNDRRLLAELPSAKLVRHHEPNEAFDIIATVELDSWKEHEHTAIISSQTDSEFYRALLALERPDMSPRVYSLDTDEGPIAYLLGILYRGVLYALKTSYRETYAGLSPGSVLHFWTMRELCAEEPNVKRLELLGNDSPRKRHLANSNRELYDYVILKNTLPNRAFAFLWTRVRPAVKENRLLGPLYTRAREFLRHETP